MNIQIFGTKKCNDTKKAERFFKERGIKHQFIDMKEKGMSKGEFILVAQVNGGLENIINWDGVRMPRQQIYDMPFGKVYDCLIAKAERKGRTRDEVDELAKGKAVDKIKRG